jgi:hypothetical protein
MRPRLDRPAVVCTAAVSLVTAVAALAPSPARADDGLQTQLPTVGAVAATVTEATAGALAAVPSDTMPAVEAVPGLEAAPAEDTDPAAELEAEPEAEPEAESTDSAPSPVPTAAGSPATTTAHGEPASQSAPAADITAGPADTGADTPPTAPVPAPPTHVPAPTGSPAKVTANVNVSVRIGSPGDNGAVTQVNVDAAPPPTPLSLAADETPEPADAAQASTPQGNGAPATGGTASVPPATVDSDTWYWSWDCLGAPSISAISPGGSAAGTFPSSWTWIWNCGDNQTQYQPETQSGYRQINTNIAIRISSPGNDGSVNQVNLAAGAAIALPAPVQGGPLVPNPVLVSPGADTGSAAAPALDEPAQMPVAAADTTDTTALAPFAAPHTSDATPIPRLLQTAPQADGGVVPVGGSWVFGVPLQTAPSPARTALPTAVWARAGVWHSAAPSRATAPGPAERARPAEVVPRERLPSPGRAPAVSTSGVSAAAASGGGGSSGSGLPVLLLLPFVAALLDLARRVALEHATWPTGHRRRAPDRPG